jgi:hypothetical protein
MRILESWEEGQPIIQTALDDLESFLWVLMWGIVHASKNIGGAIAANWGIQNMLKAWSGHMAHHKNKLFVADRSWDDVVFGNLIQEWVDILRKADKANRRVTKEMSIMCLGSQEWHDACNHLELYCNDIYKEVLESGFRYLEGVKEYSDWDAAVAANLRSC